MLILIEYKLMFAMYNAIYGILDVFCAYALLIGNNRMEEYRNEVFWHRWFPW